MNDINTLNGALQELGETMADNLVAKGVTASASDGLTTLAGKILDIQTGGSCYHIEFGEASYTAIGGSATLEIYLQENYAPKSGASVTVTGSDGSVYNGITNSQGIASVTVSNISTTITFTTSYSNVTDACTVNPAIYIINDDASVDNSSTLFGSYISLRNNGTNSVTYNPSTPCYVLKNTRGSSESLRPYSALNGYTNSFKLTVRSKNINSDCCPIGLYYYLDNNNWGGVKDEGTVIWISSKTNGSFTESNKGGNDHRYNEMTHEFIYDSVNNTLTINRYYNGAIEHTQVMNIPITLTSSVKWGTSTTWYNNTTREIYEIIAEPI